MRTFQPQNLMSRSTTTRTGELEAALGYAALGWPVVPGAVWHEGKFIDPFTGQAADNVVLRPAEDATTDPERVREWWSPTTAMTPAVLAVTGSNLGAVSVYESLVEPIIGHRWFETRPTPVLAIPGMPMAYFLVTPPCPLMLTRDAVRVLNEGTTLPLPPTAMGNTRAMWLVTPEEAGGVMLLGDEFDALLRGVEAAT